jgi:hypothetical protein
MHDLFVNACMLVLGAGLGGAGLVALWFHALRKPENARRMLQGIYRHSHPHWLQRSRTDATPVCPVCGWSETETPTGS